MAEILNATVIVDKHKNEEIKNSCKDKLPSYLESETTNDIVFTNVGNVHSTPDKDKILTQDFNNPIKYINKNTNSPHKNIYLFNQSLLKNSLFKSPVFKKLNKRANSVDTAQTDICSQRKRTISANSDSNISKSELYNTEDFESIDLLHDLDSVIKFENCRDTFLSTIMNTTQDDEGMNKDPVTDPLSISDCEKKDTDTLADSYSMSRKKRRIETRSQSQIKRQKSEYHFKKDKHKLNMEEKRVLKELNNFEEFEEMPLINIKKLLELHIKLIHKVPPQHKIELSGSHAPTKVEKRLFQKYGLIRKGSYRPIEDKIIRKNWKTFCKHHDWDPKNPMPFLYWRHNGRYYINDIEERQKFVQFLANELPWRTLYSVYSRFKVLYCNKITYSRYTTREDKKILTYIENEHLDKRYTKYSELAKLLRRTGRSVFKRYQYLKNQTLNKSETELLVDVKWTLPLIKIFIKTLLSVTVSKDIKELKDAKFPKPVWQKMEEKLNIRESALRTFWQHQLHLQLFSMGPIYLNDIKIQLIEYMYSKGISNTREIIWPNVAQHFDGATAVFLCKVFFYLVQECNMTDTNNFADVVEHLYHTKIPKIKNAYTDKFLPRIIYENGKISLLNTETSN